MNTSEKTLIISGCTASGKTQLALTLATQMPCHLISADSAMVYRGFDIGSAKPEAHIQAKYPHALIDIRDPLDIYSAADFVTDARREIDWAHENGKLPIIVGGTFLYLHALVHGLNDAPSAHPAFRAELAKQAEIHGWAFLHEKLRQIDPTRAANLSPNDGQRIQRALEIWHLTQKLPSSFGENLRQNTVLSAHWVNLDAPSRPWLHERMARRLAQMRAAGWQAEVEGLYARGDLHTELPAVRSVGYRQLWAACAGEVSWAAAYENVLIATRQLAKRQETWIKKSAIHHSISADLPIEAQVAAVQNLI